MTRDNIPCMIILKSPKFLAHRRMPTVMFSCLRVTGRNGNGRQCNMKRCMRETIPIRWVRHSGRTTRNWGNSWITSRGFNLNRLRWRTRLKKGQSRSSSFIYKSRFESVNRRSQVNKMRQNRRCRQRHIRRRKE